MEKMREFRRKTGHLLLGSLVVGGVWIGFFNGTFLFGVAFFLLGFFLFLRDHHRESTFWKKFLHFFEREKHFFSFPGKSVVLFFFGCALTTSLFSREIAAAAISILSFGDSISHLFGRQFGRITTFLHPEKKFEGTLAGIFAGGIVASLFVPLPSAFVAAGIAMILEIPEIRVFGIHLDDNLVVPLSAAIVLSLI